MSMVKIVKVWSFGDRVTVELDDGTGYMFHKEDVDTKEKMLQRLKFARDECARRREAERKKQIDGSLKHLKELEGVEIE